MAIYRKLLIASPIGLAATLAVFYSHQLVQLDPDQNQPTHAIAGSERSDESLVGSQDIPRGDGDRPVQSTTEDPHETDTASKNITVSGWVGTEFGENMAGETVILYSPSLRATYSKIANGSGEFKFPDLKPAWDYVLKVSPEGMFKRYVKSPIKLRADQEVHNIVLESIPFGVLYGLVTDPYGQPVSGIGLMLKTAEIDSWYTNVRTDANGAFSVAEFPKGKYQLAIKDQQSLRATGLKFDPDSGAPFNLTIDLGFYKLRGHIFYESGQTFDGANVVLNWEKQEKGVRIHSTRKVSADDAGEFQFTQLGPGDHDLIATAWRVDSFGQIIKQTVRQTVNIGVESGEVSFCC